MDRQLFPILSYGCHLWDLSRHDVRNAINRGLRRGIRKGLGMKKCDSITDRLEGTFQEAEEMVKILKHNFLKRAFHSANRLVRGILILVVDKKLHLGMDR